MTQAGALSPTALGWVREDLDRELDKVRMQVESIASNPNAGEAVLDSTAERIHELNLIFETLVLDGARQVTGEMHRLVSSLGNGKIRDRDAANSALLEAMVVLPAYLDRLQAGHQDLPVLLLPLLNQLRESVGESPLTEGTVFSPLLDVELPELEFVRKPGFDEPFDYLTNRLHRQYEKALQNWLQEQDDTALLSPMQGICETLRHRVKRYDLKRLWWVATELFGGLMDGHLDNDVNLRRLLARLSRLIKTMADGGEDGIDERTSTSVTQALLYPIAGAEPGSEGLDLVRERFELDKLAPDSDAMMRARGTLSGRDREMYQSLSAAVEDELAIVKDALDLELRTGQVEPERRQQSMEALRRLADTLGMLGLSGPGRDIAELVPRFEETEGADRDEREAALESLAEQLLLVESALQEQIETLGEPTDDDGPESFIPLSRHERHRLHATLLDECVATLHKAEDTVRDRLAGRAGDGLGEQLDLVIGALNMVDESETATLTTRLRDTVSGLLDRQRNGALELTREDKETVAEAMAALELFLSARRDRQRDADRFAAAVSERLERLDARTGQTVQDADPPEPVHEPTVLTPVGTPMTDVPEAGAEAEAEEQAPEEETAKAPESPVDEPMAEETAAAEHAAPEHATPDTEDHETSAADGSAEDAPPAPPTAPEEHQEEPAREAEATAPEAESPVAEAEDELPAEIDPELRDIFLEEYEEVLQTLQGAIPAWVDQLDNADALTEIRRAFHTLKGSGRMVGADELGDFSWQVENMLNTLLEGRGENFADASVMVRVAEASLPALRQRLLQERAGLSRSAILAIGEVAEAVARDQSADWSGLQSHLPMYLASLLPGGLEQAAPAPSARDDGDDETREMLRAELAEHLAPVRELMDAIAQDRDTRTHPDQVRAVHTIAGALAMEPEGLDAEVAKALEGLLERQSRSGTPFTPDAMFAVISAVGQIQNRLERLSGAGDLSPAEEQQELVDQLNHLAPHFEGAGEAPADAASDAESTSGDFAPTPTPEREPAPPKEFDPGHSVFAGSADLDDDTFTFEPAQAEDEETPESLVPGESSGRQREAEVEEPVHEPGPEAAEPVHEPGPEADTRPETGPEPGSAPEHEPPEQTPRSAPPLPDTPSRPASMAPAFDSPATPREAEPVAETPSAPAETLDQEIVAIFLEEAAEVLERGENALEQWRDDLDNLEWVQELQREIHTFKGGARMAGLASIGDYAHEMEDLLERMADRVENPSLSAVQVLEDACDRLHGWVEQVAQGRVPDAGGALDLLKQQIGGLGDVSFDPDATAPPAAKAVTPQPLDEAPDTEAAPEPQEGAAPEPAPEAAPEAAPQETKEGAAAPATADDPASGGSIRVAAELLDKLVNASGEVSIYRSRLEQQVGKLKGNLSEFDETIDRLSDQFRKMDIEIEAQIRANYPDAVQGQGDNFDPLELDQFSALQQATRSLQETVADLQSLQEMAEENLRASEQLLTRQSRVSTELQEGLMKTRMVPFGTIAPRLRRIVRSAAKEEGKQARLQLRMVGSSDELDRNVLEHITAPLEHMMRNAVAHGIEAPAQRQERNKPAEGDITITVESEATEFVIRIADDGAGINLEAIRRRAVERGLLDEHAEPSRQQLYAFMMDSGFSTSSSVTHLAGRGVGMDVVNSDIKQIGGSLEIDSEPGQGTQFTIRIPFTLAIMQAIGLEAGDARYLLPLSSVVGVSRILPDDYRKLLEHEQPVYRFAGQEYPLLDIEPLLGERPTPLGKDNVSLLILSAGEQKAAVRVPMLLPHREVVIKPVGPQISSVAGVLGGSISGDGEVMVILDPGPMIRRALIHGVTPPSEESYEAPVSSRRLVLVVDDSITMRKVTSRVLEGHDYDVITARDGVDALEQLQERTPDIMLFDIEMPRMDGYELTERVRDDGRFRSTPIMMITSRAGQKHRDRAMQAGATAYLTKPYREDELLTEVERLIDEVRH